MNKLAWFDCFSGISGDMCLGALVAAGWPASEVEAMPARLGLTGVEVSVAPVRRGAFAATQVSVRVEEAKQPHRHLHHVAAILERADLPAPVQERSLEVFRRLAAAEAEVHGSTIEKVHFHEVGAADALVDVAGTIAGLHALGIGAVYASRVTVGRGTVETQHGTIPVPAPATALLLRGAPIELGEVEFEFATPTGAALLATLVERWTSPPPMRIAAIGHGAGGKDLKPRANVLRLLVGEPDTAATASRRVAVLETALDDESPQIVAALVPRLLAAGALDAMLSPVTMKKGRPGVWLVVVAEPPDADRLAAMLLAETTTLGVRVREDVRIELPRRAAEVETAFGAIRLKVAALAGGGERAMPEFESVRDAAERSGRPLREVSEAAIEAWRREQRRPGP